jgi:hypothetical protein
MKNCEARVYASDPAYEKLNDLAQKIAWAKNPQMFIGEVDVDPLMQKCIISDLEEAMEEAIIYESSLRL